MQATQNPQVQFRRINGRIVPIKMKDGAPSQKPALTAKSKARELTQKINREGLFGSKYLNPQTIGVSVLAGLSVIGGLKGTTLAIKKVGSRLYGPKGFAGVERYITNATNLRNKAAKQAYRLSTESREAFEEIKKTNKTFKSSLNIKNIFDYNKQEDLFNKAMFLSKQAKFQQEKASKLSQNITRTKNQTGYRYTKPVVDWWKNNEPKVYAGVGTAGALTAYSEQTTGKKKRP